jgi:hypothetical protein
MTCNVLLHDCSRHIFNVAWEFLVFSCDLFPRFVRMVVLLFLVPWIRAVTFLLVTLALLVFSLFPCPRFSSASLIP